MIVTTTRREQAPGGTVLRVAGELDTFSAEDLRTHLRRLALEPDGAVLVDLSAVTFMGCAGLSVLVEARSGLGARLLVGGRSRVVRRLLDLSGLTPLFPEPAGCRTGGRTGTGDVRLPAARTVAGAGDGTGTGTGTGTWTFSRTDVHRVRGRLMAVHGCDAEQAWSMLALVAARYGVPVGELVGVLLDPHRVEPSSAAAVTAVAVLMRAPVEGGPDDADPEASDAADVDRAAEGLLST